MGRICPGRQGRKVYGSVSSSKNLHQQLQFRCKGWSVRIQARSRGLTHRMTIQSITYESARLFDVNDNAAISFGSDLIRMRKCSEMMEEL